MAPRQPRQGRLHLAGDSRGPIALALVRIGGHLYYDTRPFVREHVAPLFAHAPDNGFPSDHALLTSFLAFVSFRYTKPVAAALTVNALLVSWARVAAKVHSPIDIVGSFVFSLAVVLFVDWLDRRRRRRPPAVADSYGCGSPGVTMQRAG